jgi:hypothetical protein
MTALAVATPNESPTRTVTEWQSFVAALHWQPGFLDESSYRAALEAARRKIPKETVLNEIVRRIEIAGDMPKPEKIHSQIERAWEYVNGQGEKNSLPVSRTRFCPAALRRIAEKLPVENIHAFLALRSAIDPDHVTSESFLRTLYKPGEKVVVFTVYESQGQAVWPDCGDALPTTGPNGVWYLVDPVDGRFHANPRQRTKSRRSQESVTDFRFAVLESDEADLDDWLKCLAQIPLPIAAIYESGGRSIHALVQVNAKTKMEWDEKMRAIKPLLITLGADPNALTAVRLSRLPQAKRGDRLQRLIYLQPNSSDTPICERPVCSGQNEGAANE